MGVPRVHCVHCGKPPGRGKSAPRGLCWPHYRDPAVRALYPTRLMGPGGGAEPTAADVERLVAEQMLCLPAWWDEEYDRERDRDRDRERTSKVYTLVKCA